MPSLAERIAASTDASAAKTLTIGVPAYNEERSLPNLLQTLLAQQVPPDWNFEIVVVANGCSDRTADVAATVRDEVVGLDARDRFVIHELARANKADALNLVHRAAGGEAVAFFDADIVLGLGVVRALCSGLDAAAGAALVAVAVEGSIPAFNPAKGRAAELVRVAVSRAINEFDRHVVRVDGRAFAYRRELLEEFPQVIAIDYWVEGFAWHNGADCRYRRDASISYHLPACYTELVKQYVRYDRTIAQFSETYPQLIKAVYAARASASDSPSLWARALGYSFLALVHRRAASEVFNEEEPWEPIESTKR